MIYRIYGHKSPSNKWYIGYTGEEKPEYRWNNGKNYRESPKLYNALLKYGNGDIEEGFSKFEHIFIAETDTIESALICEEMFKRMYNSVENGYNCFYSEKDAPSKDPEIAKKISQSKMGHKVSEETKMKISKSLTGKPNPHKARPQTQETKDKISKSLMGNTRNKGKTWKLIDGKRVWTKKEIL